MEWIALVIWVLVACVGLPLGRNALKETAWLGLQATAAGAGLALCVLFLIIDRPPIVAWGAVALGAMGTVAVAAAAAWLLSETRSVSAAGQAAEEADALLASVALGLFPGAVLFSLLMALDVGVVG